MPMLNNNYDYPLDLESKNSLSVIVSKIETGSTVLEFGPANGRMTRYLKERLSCKVYGVEIDAAAANESRMYTEEIVVDDIENLSWMGAFENISFDVIVFADVLEHLYDPLRVLRHAMLLMREGGRILVSIPNMTHNAIIMELLKEKFTYRNAGLLDSTHIRFFSKHSFEDLIDKSDLRIFFEETIFVPPELTELKHHYEELPYPVADFFENREYGEAYQFIFGLQCKKETEAPLIPLYKQEKTPRYAQLFLDIGEGYGEHIETIRLKEDEEDTCLEFDISRYNSIIGMRFDPINRCAIIRIDECILTYKNGMTKEVSHKVSNAQITDNKVEYFTTYDPIYHLEVEGELPHGEGILRICMHYREDSYVSIMEQVIDLQNGCIAEHLHIIAVYEKKINASLCTKAYQLVSPILQFLKRCLP